MNSKELQGKLQSLQRLLDRGGELSEGQRLAILQLRKQVHGLRADKQQLKTENRRLTSRINRLLEKLGDK